jgi:hypothetical protein
MARAEAETMKGGEIEDGRSKMERAFVETMGLIFEN